MTGTVPGLPGRWGREPYLLVDHGLSTVLGAWSTADGLVALVEGTGRPAGLLGLGPADVVASLVEQAARAVPDAVRAARYATLTHGAWERLGAGGSAALDGMAASRSAWEWMVTSHPLSGVDPAGVQRLPADAATGAEVTALLARAHPAAETAPDDPRLVGWWGVREGGRLVAAVGAIRFGRGLAPYLVSLGVDPDHRGHGLAAKVLAAAVRDGLAEPPEVGPPMVGLALYAENDRARRVYLRCGFRLEHRFSSARRG